MSAFNVAVAINQHGAISLHLNRAKSWTIFRCDPVKGVFSQEAHCDADTVLKDGQYQAAFHQQYHPSYIVAGLATPQQIAELARHKVSFIDTFDSDPNQVIEELLKAPAQAC